MVTALLEYLDPVILYLFGFALSFCSRSSTAIQTIKGTATMKPIYTNFQVILILSLPCSHYIQKFDLFFT